MAAASVIALMGATATGKTDLAVELCERYPLEIISVDSALIYRGMDIGTAKPEPLVLSRAPHFLVDIIDPAESFSVWDFVQQSRRFVGEINARGNTALMVGGTMMYYHAFEQGLNELPVADERLRETLDKQGKTIGWEAMHSQLLLCDPESAQKIRPTDSQRIQRALEVFQLTGKPLSLLQKGKRDGFDGKIEKIILSVEDRSLLHQRIELRFKQMLEAGFLNEVEGLKQRGDLGPDLPSMRCVGYRQAWQYLDSELSYQELVEKAVAATRQLAKRQITWLRKQPQDRAFDCLRYRKGDIFGVVDGIISKG
ncbi:MAG: tRNA dimethylallyltransferase [Planctomycetota bacterium]